MNFFFDESGFDELVLYPILIVPHVIFLDETVIG